MRTRRAAPLHRKTRPSRPQSRAGHSRVRTTVIRPTAAGARTRYRAPAAVPHCRSGRFVRQSSCFPFSRGIPPPGPAFSLGNRGNRPLRDREGRRGPGESPPRNPGALPFSTSTPRAALATPRGPVQSSPRPAVRDAPGAHGPPVAAVARHPSAARQRPAAGRSPQGHAQGSPVFDPRMIAIRDEPKHGHDPDVRRPPRRLAPPREPGPPDMSVSRPSASRGTLPARPRGAGAAAVLASAKRTATLAAL